MIDFFELEILDFGDDSELGRDILLIYVSFSHNNEFISFGLFNYNEEFNISMMEG